MKVEIFRDGKLYMTIDQTDGSDDLVVLPKSLSKGSRSSSESFKELFFKCMKDSSNGFEAYEKAETIHEMYFENRRYSSYESFTEVKNRK